MADCYAPEADDLHRRWLPREIFADIGIVDPEPLAVVETEDAAAAVAAAEELAVHLVGIMGADRGKGKSPPRTTSPPPPALPAPASAAVPAPCHLAAPACGLEGAVFMTYVCGTAVAGDAAGAWPVTPYSPVQWQVGSNFMDYSMLPPAPPCLPLPLSHGAMPRGGTGVFLPRTNAFRRAHSPVKDGKASRPWIGGRPVHQQQPQQKHKEDGAAAAWWRSQNGKQEQQKATSAALALPKDWSYSL